MRKKADRPISLGKRAWLATKVLGRVGRTAVVFRVFNSRVEGRENIPRKGPAVFASNHRSFADIFFCWPALRRVVAIMAMVELWKDPKLERVRWLLNLLGIPVDRAPAGAGHEAHRVAATVLDHGGSVLVYPEARIPHPDEDAPFKTGAARLAIETGALLVPMAVIGTENVLPMKWAVKLGAERFNRKAPVLVRIGKPFYTSEFGNDPRACTQELERRVRELETA